MSFKKFVFILLMDIPCADGHPNIEELVLSRLSHIRSLVLKNLPKLKRLSIYDDFEKEQGYFEELDISKLSKDCEILLEVEIGTIRK